MADQPPKENPEKDMSFKLHPTNAIKLKQSIAALCDSKFNPQGIGMVEITEKGFEITVRNTKTKAVGKLFLSSSGLIDFHCKSPIVGKMINLNQILENATDDDTITVFHLDGSTYLSFIFGKTPTEELTVEFLEIDAEFEKLPDMDICCETGLESKILREIIEQLTEKGNPVSLGISEKLVTVVVGRKDAWSIKIKEDDENFEARVLTDAQDYHAWFKLEHLEAMKKASTVAPRFHIRFHTEPSENIMTRFELGDVGELVFVHKAMLIVKNPPKYDVGKNFENTSEVIRLFNDLRQGR